MHRPPASSPDVIQGDLAPAMTNNTPEQRELRKRNVRLGLILATVVLVLLFGFVVRRYLLLGH